MKLRNLFFCVIVLTSFSGCLAEDIEDPKRSIPEPNKLDLSFSSSPKEHNILGTLSISQKIPSSTLDVLISHNETSIHCGNWSPHSCQISVSMTSSSVTAKEFQIFKSDGSSFPSCYDDCRLEVSVLYLGVSVGSYEAINF